MQIYVMVKVKESKLNWLSNYNIHAVSKEYKVDYEIEYCDLGLFRTKYMLKIEGDEENIRTFLSYLKMCGCKIGKINN